MSLRVLQNFDRMEANAHAFAATPHTCVPDPGVEGHYVSCDGVGCCRNTHSLDGTPYGPGPAFAIDTTKPFGVNTTFSTGTTGGKLSEIETLLSQGANNIVRLVHDDASCGAGYLAALDGAVRKGMTVVATNWGSTGKMMSWLDVPPCAVDTGCASNELRVSKISVELLD